MASQHAGALSGPGNWPAVVLTALPAADAVLTGLRLLLRPAGARGGPRRPNREGNYPGRNREADMSMDPKVGSMIQMDLATETWVMVFDPSGSSDKNWLWIYDPSGSRATYWV